MLRGLWQLTWLEIKIFVREPLGVVGTVGVPVVLFAAFSRMVGPQMRRGARDLPRVISADLPILTSMLVALGAVLSLVAIMAIYREGGILKRLRATPLRPYTILTAHVLVKMVLTAVTVALMALAGRRYYPVDPSVPLGSFAVAVIFSTVAVLSLGFLIASLVPTARFAQPIGAAIFYPMLGVSGLFVPLDALPPVLRGIGRVLPLTYAVSLLRGVWHGEGWARHASDVAMLVLISAVCTLASAKVFRWE
jgi:ABC-2 type transport system permease protein